MVDGRACKSRTITTTSISARSQTMSAGGRKWRPSFLTGMPIASSSQPSRLFDLRGGASPRRSAKPTSGRRTASLSSSSTAASKKTVTGKRKVGAGKLSDQTKEPPSAFADTMLKYKRILPLTRVYITLVAAATLLGLILGEERTQGWLALDPLRVLYGGELWRPFTAACFLGPPSIGWLMSGYYLFEYGSALERAYGTPQHLVFLASQVVLLSILSGSLGQPFFAASVITAMLHVLSRQMPHQKVKWLVFTVPYWSLPYGLMVTDVLQAQSAAAALPHVLGILSGHFYQFHKFVWPKRVLQAGDHHHNNNNADWLVAPDFVVDRLDPDARRLKQSVAAKASSAARKRSQGRKLGSA